MQHLPTMFYLQRPALPWRPLPALLLALALGRLGCAWAQGGETPPAAVWLLAEAVRQSGDARGHGASGHFGVIDKTGARLWIFSPRGHVLAHSPVLLGQAPGDVAPPDIGTRPLSRVRAHEKVTPAGRFLTEEGVNHQGEDIVWLDYDSALSMHRVRNVAGERRHQRIASDNLADKRISYGCINIPASFFDQHVKPLFGHRKSMVYILPEEQQAAEVFPFMRAGGTAAPAPPGHAPAAR
ncbi:L,D-transpeptidase [Comamonadaceae bacterium OH2545_COT-014]|nr:L,D-transpeptidase [Comamonadaceae bacterium OH2545_COT-014]